MNSPLYGIRDVITPPGHRDSAGWYSGTVGRQVSNIRYDRPAVRGLWLSAALTDVRALMILDCGIPAPFLERCCGDTPPSVAVRVSIGNGSCF